MIEELIRAKPSAAKGRYIRTVTLASTQGPGIKVDPSRTRDIVGGGELRRRLARSGAIAHSPKTSGSP